jgi:polyhydroxyalkanoate synthesis repressor PhaR
VADSTPTNGKAKDGKGSDGEAVVIKKYANRRLYNTASSAYVTLDDLARMVREGTDFVVFDAKTNEDLTRQILTQIIFEEESRGQALLPVQFLRQLIGFYGGQMEGVLPSYLQMSLENFSRQQETFREQMTKAVGVMPGGMMGAGMMEAAAKQNMAMFEQAMKMFPPFALGRGTEAAPAAHAPTPAPAADPALDEMRRQMDEMRAQIDRLAASRDSQG